MLKFGPSQLAYCTNIHPAESWRETRKMLQSQVLAVRNRVAKPDESFGIGLRLSALAAHELLMGDQLTQFRNWLDENHCHVFTINGFPYGGFHGKRVKEKVFQPDWTTAERVDYTKNLFRILAEIARPDLTASVSTLPGSHKSFGADESLIRKNLSDFALWLDDLASHSGMDFHLGLEPEPFGYFENSLESIRFFDRLRAERSESAPLSRRVGINYG
ncbi:MAG: hypothetical protein ACO3RV_03945, partial [Luteolibacter sp.]